MTPQPIDGTLLAAFQRFADLSCYWHRHGTPDSLAMSELEERHRLERDIPELIKRNTAFADLVSSRMFDAVAKVHAEPPRDDAGQGWRMLDRGEVIQAGDEWRYADDIEWEKADISIGKVFNGPVGTTIRRRIAKNGASDTVGGIRADYQPKREED